MSCSVAPNGRVLVKQHVSHRNQSCFDLTARVILNRLQAENEFTFGDKRVALDAVQLCRSQHRCLCENEILFQDLSLRPNSVRIASFVFRIFVANVTAWWPIKRLVARQLLNIISVVQTGTSDNIIRFAFFTFAGRADGPCKLGSWPASRRLARTVLATL